MDAYEGVWKQLHQEKFEEYLQACGVSFFLRKFANSVTPTVEYRREEDGSWTFVFTSTIKSGKWNFKVGEESEETTPDGRQYLSTVTIEDGKFIHKQLPIKNGQKESLIVRWFEGDEMHTTCTCDGVVATFVLCRG